MTDLLALTGMTKEELADRVVAQMVRELLYEGASYEDEAPVTRFAKQLRKQIRLGVDRSVREVAERHVVPQIGPLLEGLFLQPTNRWGEPDGKGETFVEHVTRMAREYWSEDVDYNGKSRSEVRSCDWRKRTTRAVYLVDEYFRVTIERALKDVLKEGSELFVGGIESGIKDALADIAKRLKVRAEVPR